MNHFDGIPIFRTEWGTKQIAIAAVVSGVLFHGEVFVLCSATKLRSTQGYWCGGGVVSWLSNFPHRVPSVEYVNHRSSESWSRIRKTKILNLQAGQPNSARSKHLIDCSRSPMHLYHPTEEQDVR